MSQWDYKRHVGAWPSWHALAGVGLPHCSGLHPPSSGVSVYTQVSSATAKPLVIFPFCLPSGTFAHNVSLFSSAHTFKVDPA